MPRTRLFVTRWLPVLVWMTLIFMASADPESGPRGSRILVPLIRLLAPGISPDHLEQVVFFLRKVAHFVAFAGLGALLWRALAAAHPGAWRTATAARALGWTAAYAVSDEFHQAFVPTRVASGWDVLIDSLGAACALGLLWGWGRLRRRW